MLTTKSSPVFAATTGISSMLFPQTPRRVQSGDEERSEVRPWPERFSDAIAVKRSGLFVLRKKTGIEKRVRLRR
jgi:hypothetical protein